MISSLISPLQLTIIRSYADDTQLYISFKSHLFADAASSLQTAFSSVSSWMASNLLALNPTKTEFLIIGSPQQLEKVSVSSISLPSNITVNVSSSARNLGFVFDSHLSHHEQISALTKACFFHIRDLRRIRTSLNSTTAALIATSLIHSKLDYCNSLYLNLPACELDRLQHIQNALARAVFRTHDPSHVTPLLHSLHWLKIRERIIYEVLLTTYSTLQTSRPTYLSHLLTVQSPRITRSSDLITLSRPSFN